MLEYKWISIYFYECIYDNIRVTRQSATLDEVRDAAKAADAHEFIKRLPI